MTTGSEEVPYKHPNDVWISAEDRSIFMFSSDILHVPEITSLYPAMFYHLT